jgi:hypothetical protein
MGDWKAFAGPGFGDLEPEWASAHGSARVGTPPPSSIGVDHPEEVVFVVRYDLPYFESVYWLM